MSRVKDETRLFSDADCTCAQAIELGMVVCASWRGDGGACCGLVPDVQQGVTLTQVR